MASFQLGSQMPLPMLTPEQVRIKFERDRRRSEGQVQQPTTPKENQGRPLPLPETKPLFQRCVDLIATLYSFPLFEFYLFPDGVEAYLQQAEDPSALPAISDPVEVLWNCFKLGAPLCVVYNELAAATTGSFLKPADVSTVRPPFYPTMPCKDNLYKFITACRQEMNMQLAAELGGVSELYKDDTAGFMKFLKLVEELILLIEKNKNLPAPKPLPFSTEISKDITNPLDNRAVSSKSSSKLNYQSELAATKVFSKDMMHQLFSNLNELVDFQRRFMVGMESTLNLGLAEQRIGQLFLLNEEAFEVYYPFCANYQTAQNFALMQGEELKQLSHIIQPHQIQSYLIKPVQRLMKYPMLLKELIKLTDQSTYPYMDELKEGLESIKRVAEKLNEVQRKDENERNRLDLIERMEDWKGLQPRDFGELLLMERFLIASNDQEREYYLFLFEKILLCCKKDTSKQPNKRQSNRKRSDAGKPGELNGNHVYILRGNIYISSILRVEDSSEPTFGAFSIKVYWKEASEPDLVCFSLKCRNEEQVALWTGRLQRQVDLYKSRKNSAGNPMSPFQSNGGGYQPTIMSRSSDGYSTLGGYGGQIMGGSPMLMRSPSNPNPSLYGTSYIGGYGGQIQQYQQQFGRQMSFAGMDTQQQPVYYMENGVMMQASPSGVSDRRFLGGQGQGFGPSLADQQRMRSMSGGAGPLPPNRMDSMSTVGQITPRMASMKTQPGGGGWGWGWGWGEVCVWAATAAAAAAGGCCERGAAESKYGEWNDDGVWRVPKRFWNGGFAGDRNSPSSAALMQSVQSFQFPPPPQQTPAANGLQQHMQQQQQRGSTSSPRSPGVIDGAPPQQMRRNPTAPSSYLSPTTASGGSPTGGQRYLIIAMPVRGATLQELRNRVERKTNMMPHKPILSNPIQMVVKEEVQMEGGAKEWRLAFNTNTGLLNLFLS
ncbi:hypothetical protein BCR33DRAFT_719503 [Rhizoclosmatium globosum]|uniref:DH domain-containing protein n=1 Tax=Rhizoclosmatium globosum TaxID=329046 RepID=A0A1Y2BZ96_9FUNG|nr:hypothetical protein BCR33DRAFT_719503 [Rhizoclosmatium globosum]|eukprot:ORY40088.1 hypothetical protein BCR33DRAFT_719503 [Rhizoclosmatium globosum]